MDQVWFAEHKIRALISGRGMRPSRAIARVLGLSDPEQIKALAALWIDGELAVTIGDDESLFVAGYRDVRSCMQGKGSLCYKAYAPHGTKIAVATVGGALWLMAPLAAALRVRGIEPVFAFSVRDTEEQKQADGSVSKVAVFRHTGFVPAIP